MNDDEKRASEQLEKTHAEKARENVEEGEAHGSDQAKLPADADKATSGGEGGSGSDVDLAPGSGPSGGEPLGGATGGAAPLTGSDGPTGGAE